MISAKVDSTYDLGSSGATRFQDNVSIPRKPNDQPYECCRACLCRVPDVRISRALCDECFSLWDEFSQKAVRWQAILGPSLYRDWLTRRRVTCFVKQLEVEV